MSTSTLWFVVILSGAATYIIRILPFFLFRLKPMSSDLSSFFEYASYSLLGILAGQNIIENGFTQASFIRFGFFLLTILISRLSNRPVIVFYAVFSLYFLTEKYFLN